MKKKDNNLEKRRPLKGVFFLNYIVISGLLLGAMGLSLFCTDLVMNRWIDQRPDVEELQVENFYDSSGKLGGQLLERYGGWLEVVNESGHVIEVEGEKADEILYYSLEELFARIQALQYDHSMIYHVFSITGPAGESYKLLWKIPERLEYLYTALGIFAILFAFFLLIALYFYTHYSVRQLKKPLKQIVEGIKELDQFNPSKRLFFSAEKEFAEIRDAFNDMAERLQRISEEKERVENHRRNMLLHLSHDLKTPITSVLGYSQLLLDDMKLEEKQKRQCIQYIYHKSHYMSALIQDLFELAKLEDNHVKLNLEKVNITKWFQELIAEHYPEIEEKGYQVDIHIPETPVYVRIDPIYMKRVVTNILGNALTYNPAGTRLFVSCEQKEEGAILWLGDNGSGVPEQIREDVFEEFISGADPVKGSTGLGLAICKKIMTLHQGSIELTKDQHYSTLFRIGLPSEEI